MYSRVCAVLCLNLAVDVLCVQRQRPSACEFSDDLSVATCRDKFLNGIASGKEEFPDGLVYLDFSGNSMKELNDYTLPEWNIHDVKYLNMSRNNIMTVTELAFFGLYLLENVDLSRNRINSFHRDAFLFLPKLLHLNLSENFLTYIEEGTFSENKALETLLLANNNIVAFNNFVFNVENSLNLLDVSGNELTEFGSILSVELLKLKELRLSRNELQTIPGRSFAKCRHVSYLLLSENNISIIESEAFYGLENLEHLDLSRNDIARVRAFAFELKENTSVLSTEQDSVASNLKFLNLSHNKINSFNFEEIIPIDSYGDITTKFSNLQTVDLSSNSLETLDETSVSWLRTSSVYVNFSGNKWKCLCDTLYDIYRELKNIVTLQCEFPDNLNGYNWTVLEDVLQCHIPANEPEQVSYSEYNDDEERYSTPSEQDKISPDPFYLPNVLISGIHVVTILVAIIVVLLITHKYIAGKPEEDEFW
ncbi:leucine-rich repeat-containing protein 70-like [Periplaneta americana]|uniref:leucine-rich repeat-containing protein 70-like n=1 Tax=Periplaneta americana TaxID=6978 RepID=UPI0037E75FBC